MSLAARGLVKRYGRRRVVDGVEIAVSPGETVGLLGPNGAGKTTTFYMIVGLVAPNGGTVSLDGRDITGMRMHRRQPPHQPRQAGTEHQTADNRQLQTRGDHLTASPRAAAPMNRGNGFPAAILRIQTSTATYTPSSNARIT